MDYMCKFNDVFLSGVCFICKCSLEIRSISSCQGRSYSCNWRTVLWFCMFRSNWKLQCML